MTKTFRNKNFIKKSLIILSISSVIISNYSFPVSALESSTPINNSIEKNYTISYLNKLDYDTLIKFIKTSTDFNFNEFFKFNKDTIEFYSNTNRLDKLIDALEISSHNYTKDDTREVCNLIEVIRAGYYIGAYHNELALYRTDKYKAKPNKALSSIINNKNFKLGSKSQNELINSVGKFIGNSSASSDVINSLSKILTDFSENFSTYSLQQDKSSAVYSLLNGVNQVVNYEYSVEDENLSTNSFYKNIDPFITSLEKLCITDSDKINESNEYIVNNALYYTGILSKFKSNANESQRALTNAMNKYSYLSYQYLEAAQAIDKNFNHKDYNGKIINFNDIKEDAKNKYLSNTYTFDDGKFIVKAGDKVSAEKIKRMYWASKEVKAQFMRLIQNDTPLESNNPDDILTVVIYNSPTEYKLNQKLYGCNTDNGGIYIEKTGTFFTYERTPEESIYTLEELFRHEFTHYLQGRYLVNGMWGEGNFYKNNELTWYEEGSAEFFAGSTRTDGVKPRSSIVRNLKYNDPMELKDLLHSSYGGWNFYNYGCAFSSYLYNSNPEAFKSLSNYIKNNDINGYKNYISNLSNKDSLNTNYKSYINELVNNDKNIGTPLVSDYYTVRHGYKNPGELYSEITATANLKNANIQKHHSQFFDTFTLTGTYTGTQSKGENSDWRNMNSSLDNTLKELAKRNWLGYKTLTAYFKNHKVDSNGNYQYEVVIHGILNTDPNSKSEQDFDLSPVANIVSKTRNYAGETIEFNGSNSKDPDGKIVSYNWDFGDGNKSTDINPKHTFNKNGVYTVTLSVTDNFGKITTTSKQIEIVNKNKELVINEVEDNNRFSTSNEINRSNTTVKGILSKGDIADSFYFDVTKEGEVSISLKNTNFDNVSWLVYDAKNTSNYLMFPDLINNELKGSMNLKPGRYYINVYRFDRNASPDSYDLNVEGNINKKEQTSSNQINDTTVNEIEKKPSTPVVNNNINEIEKNDSYESAMPINLKNIISSSISKDDTTDIYKFTLDKETDLKIVLENKKNLGVNWLLYSTDDLSNYIDYAKANGSNLESTCSLKKGTYYIYVYSYDSNSEGSYKLNLL